MAPEILLRVPYGKPVDIWSIGVLCYFLLCGYAPFDNEDQMAQLQNVIRGNFDFDSDDCWQSVSEVAKDFIRKCLAIDPTTRPTAEELLQHAWLLNTKVAKVDLSPHVSERFNAIKTFKRAVRVVRAVNKIAHAKIKSNDEATMMENVHGEY